jgi:hypothetical protein
MADFISGLLGMGDDDPMQRAKNAGLLGLGASLLQAGAPSLTPQSLGAALGQGVMAGQQMSGQAMQQARQQQIQKEMMGTMSGAQGGDTAARIAQLQKMALLDPKNATTYLKLADQMQGKAPVFTGEAANQALNLFGTADVSKLTPDQRAQAIAAADRSRANAAPRVSVNTSDPTAVAKELRAVVNDFDTRTKEPREVVKQYRVMENAVNNPSPAGDVSLVFSYYKTIDPTSTVREGEYDTIVNATSVPDRIKNYAQRLRTGQKLTDSMRQDLLNTARQNVMAVAPQVQNTYNNYSMFVRSLDRDPSKILKNPLEGLDFLNRPSAATPPPAAPSAAPAAPVRRQRWNPAINDMEDIE